MQPVSQLYVEQMGELIRQPSQMRLTFHYPTGAVTYTNEDITKVTETKTAHLIAGELPSITLDMELLNVDGLFDPNDDSGLHDMIVEGVRVNYEFGYDIPLVKPYGYEDELETYDPVYGMSGGDTPQYRYYTDEGFIDIPQEAYGFVVGQQTEWIAGGEVFTDGELEYDQESLSVRITAVDYLSKLDVPVYFGHGQISLAQIAQRVIDQTDYPEDNSGKKKVILGSSLEQFITAFNISGHSDEAIPAKEWLQIIAHAGGVQMYIDREGYIVLQDREDEEEYSPPVYHLPLVQQHENPEHSKLRIPKKLIVELNTEYGDPLEVDLGGGGEDMIVENPYIILTSNAEKLRDRIEEQFIPFRNEANIVFRGEPALDILDVITFDAPFAENIEGTIVESTLTFDGTLEGELTVRYSLGENTPDTVKISGAGNFTYPLEKGVPIQPTYTLECKTDLPSPTYKWSYFTISDGSWKIISGETTKYLTVNYDDIYFSNDDTVTFRCTVNNKRSSITRISNIQLVKSPNASYRGTIEAEDKDDLLNEVVSPEVGDIVLLDNTEEESGIYGETYVYNGDEWVATEESDALAMTYKDALQLAEDSGKTIYSSKIFTDLLVANKGFIDNLYVKNLKVGTGDSEEVEFDAIECNGSSSYAETSAFAIAGADRTFEMWIKPEIIDSYTGLFIQNTNVNDTSSNNIVGFQGYPGSSNEITLAIGSSSAYYITGKVALPTGVWTHLAGVIEGGVSAKVYLNGNLLINEAISISPSTGSLKVIMGRIKDKYFKGMARDFRIWNTVRTQQQIQDNMLVDLVGNESGLIALWKANEMTSTTLTDSVGSNNATATGISWVTDIGIISGTGFKFTAVQDDGTGQSRFDVYYNGERVFEANPQNGRVYFGNNFWYDPATKSIRTPNDKTVINADGTINADSGLFKGTIIGEGGEFKGSLDTAIFSALPGPAGSSASGSFTSSAENQIRGMSGLFVDNNLQVGVVYRVAIPQFPDVAKMVFSKGRHDNFASTFYNDTNTQSWEMRSLYGTFGYIWESSFSGTAISVTIYYGGGDIFKFKSSLPVSSTGSGLEPGQVYLDGTTLKMVPYL